MQQAANWMGGPMPGVIGHLKNPSVPEVVELAGAAESAGAHWLGLADTFWWRDVWVLLTVAAGATTRLWLGPAMTNPYLRHPFSTVATLATLQELAGPRVFLGLAAGGSEARLAAKVDRRDAPARTAALIELVRRVATGQPLDVDSGRHLDVPLAALPVLVAGGLGDLRRRHADQALIWATAGSELGRVSEVIRDGAAARADGGPEVVWTHSPRCPMTRTPMSPMWPSMRCSARAQWWPTAGASAARCWSRSAARSSPATGQGSASRPRRRAGRSGAPRTRGRAAGGGGAGAGRRA